MRRLIIFLIAVIAVLAVMSSAFAADVNPVETKRWETRYYTWTLASGERAVQTNFCGCSKTLEVKVSGGTVNLTLTIQQGPNDATIKTDTLTAADTYVYEVNHPVSSLTITLSGTGTVDSITLECPSR